MAELSGTLQSRYRLESLIAHGGIASTCLGHDTGSIEIRSDSPVHEPLHIIKKNLIMIS